MKLKARRFPHISISAPLTPRRLIPIAMESSKRIAGAVAALPDDPLLEILSRVPAKSVCRFKCVSKAWRDLIADPDHRKKLPHAMRGLFFETYEEETGRDDSVGSISLSFLDLTARSVPLDIDPCFSFLTGLPGIQTLVFRDSCNGLILLENRREPHSGALGYIVCNPTTKQWGAVPTCGSPTMVTYIYLAFDPVVSSHFNLVQLQMEDEDDEAKLISLNAYPSETGSWSRNKADKQEEQGQLVAWRQEFRFIIQEDPRPRCPFVNGFLHLIVWDWDQHQIAVLDIRGNARRMIKLPHAGDAMCYFGESQGHLHYLTQEAVVCGRELSYNLSVWVLQHYDRQDWALKHTVNSLQVFGKTRCACHMYHFEVVDIHRDCNVIFFAHRLRRSSSAVTELVAYDMGRKEARVIASNQDWVVDTQKWLMGTARYVPYFAESPILTNKL